MSRLAPQQNDGGPSCFMIMNEKILRSVVTFIRLCRVIRVSTPEQCPFFHKQREENWVTLIGHHVNFDCIELFLLYWYIEQGVWCFMHFCMRLFMFHVYHT